MTVQNLLTLSQIQITALKSVVVATKLQRSRIVGRMLERAEFLQFSGLKILRQKEAGAEARRVARLLGRVLHLRRYCDRVVKLKSEREGSIEQEACRRVWKIKERGKGKSFSSTES